MNPKQSIFETCNNVQTETDFKTGSFEACDSNQTKKGRGGARKNSGKKSSGIETVTVRIDKRLLNTVTEIKDKFKTTESLDDIISKSTPKNDDAKLLKKIAKLEREKDEMRDFFFDRMSSDSDKISALKLENDLLKIQLSAARAMYAANISQRNSSGLDEKLRKRLIQALHPDKFQDARQKAVNGELVQALNGLAK